MQKSITYTMVAFFMVLVTGCHKKLIPATSPTTINAKAKATTSVAATVIADSNVTKKIIVKKKLKEPVPAIITVNDASASKTADGRYFYDLAGHRYWRNNKDGKYYLFNKSMYDNVDFKPL